MSRKVEMFVGYEDKTWDTVPVEIPKDTPQDKVEQVAKEAFYKTYVGNCVTLGEFVGVFDIHKIKVDFRDKLISYLANAQLYDDELEDY